MRGKPRHPQAQAGFTLIEVMVALSIVALAGLALLNVVGQSARSVGAREMQVLARVVLENQLIEAVISPATQALASAGEEVQRGRRFSWQRRIEPTSQQGLWRITVQVSSPEGGAGVRPVLAEAVTFRSANS
jgi:general secretion pathway protein I